MSFEKMFEDVCKRWKRGYNPPKIDSNIGPYIKIARGGSNRAHVAHKDWWAVHFADLPDNPISKYLKNSHGELLNFLLLMKICLLR